MLAIDIRQLIFDELANECAGRTHFIFYLEKLVSLLLLLRGRSYLFCHNFSNFRLQLWKSGELGTRQSVLDYSFQLFLHQLDTP